jgi:hypothetical protein
MGRTVVEKHSAKGASSRFAYAFSEMQGWRISECPHSIDAERSGGINLESTRRRRAGELKRSTRLRGRADEGTSSWDARRQGRVLRSV